MITSETNEEEKISRHNNISLSINQFNDTNYTLMSLHIPKTHINSQNETANTIYNLLWNQQNLIIKNQN